VLLCDLLKDYTETSKKTTQPYRRIRWNGGTWATEETIRF